MVLLGEDECPLVRSKIKRQTKVKGVVDTDGQLRVIARSSPLTEKYHTQSGISMSTSFMYMMKIIAPIPEKRVLNYPLVHILICTNAYT